MDIDLVMTTRNRHACVERLCASLVDQSRCNFRLVAGLQEPDAAMRALVARYAARFPIHVVSLPACGLSEARNRLLPELTGRIVALTDDDCAYHPQAMAALEDFFCRQADVDACIATACTTVHDLPPAPHARVAVNRWNVFYNAPSWLLFFRSAAMRRVGAFDTMLGVGAASPWQSGEETDYALRLLALGGKILREGSIGVQHPCGDFSSTNTAKWYAYGLGRTALLHKHGFPCWFIILNILYPLVKIVQEPRSHWRSRWALFRGRLAGLMQKGRYYAKKEFTNGAGGL